MTAALVARMPQPRLLKTADPGPALDQMNDAQVAQRHLQGDPLAFGALVDRYQSRLRAFIARGTGDRERAEDLVQEVFIRVFRHLHRCDQTRGFATWICAIASNLCKNELRNRSRSPLVPFPSFVNGDGDRRPMEFEDPTTRPDDLYHQRCLTDAVEQSVKQLRPCHREVFVLRELEGRSYTEIADITGRNLGTVKSRLSRARRRFAEVMRPLHLD